MIVSNNGCESDKRRLEALVYQQLKQIEVPVAPTRRRTRDSNARDSACQVLQTFRGRLHKAITPVSVDSDEILRSCPVIVILSESLNLTPLGSRSLFVFRQFAGRFRGLSYLSISPHNFIFVSYCTLCSPDACERNLYLNI